MDDLLKPNKKELILLNLAYPRFYDLFEIIMSDNFYELDTDIRFFYIKDIISVYSELLNYEPIIHIIKTIKTQRPPMEAEISSDLLKFIRNILIHFPFYKTWDDVWVNKELLNWSKSNGSIDKFLQKYVGHSEIKYRMWRPDKKEMVYVDINFPSKYLDDKIYLKEIISEKNGILFLCGVMKNVLDTQIVKS